MKKAKVDIVINTFKVRDLVLETIKSVYKNQTKEDSWNVIVVDNASEDGTVEAVREKFPQAKLLASPEDLGFAKGNNLARKDCHGEYVLFLNPDTIVKDRVIQKTVKILDEQRDVGLVGCKVMLPTGELDYSCHRGLPTVWNTMSYWLGFSSLFPKSKTFAGYTATYLDYNESHEIDCVTGAYLLIRKSILDKISWWDEDYFWNGEDIEMCYQVKKLGFKIWYEASGEILHFKGSSSGLTKTSKVVQPQVERIKVARAAAGAMRIFMKKHWSELGPAPMMILAYIAVWFLEKFRLTKLKLGLKYG